MSRTKATSCVAVVVATFALVGQPAGASSPGAPPDSPRLSTAYNTVGLSAYATSGTTCGQSDQVTADGQRLGYCQTWDGTARLPIRRDQRIRGVFRGTATLTLPANIDAVRISYGRQPPIAYTPGPTVVWPLPGSGTYHMQITLAWHDESSSTETTYYVPLWVPRTK